MRSDNSKTKEIFKDLSFSEEQVKIIESAFFRVNYKKGAIILEANNNVDFQYYILEGCLRTYHVDKIGKEHTIQFGVKDWWISDYTAFFSNSKAIMNIEVIQDAVLYRISRIDIERLYSKIPIIETFFRIKLERAFAAFQKRILSNLSQTATERYLNFISKYPTIERSVKNYHIASYLGITTESLSRIRKDLAQS